MVFLISHRMRDENDAPEDDAKTALASVFSEFGGESLRDVWLFDQSAFEALYLREDVAEKLETVDVARFVDNERYGFVTRDTYDQLYYASYQYTARGFDDFEQFRTFFGENGYRLGVFASFDQRDGGYEFATLNERVEETASRYELSSVTPSE